MKGRKRSSITPAATFESVPCSARPTARPAAPKTAMRLAVWTPSSLRTASTVTVRMAYLIRLVSRPATVGSTRRDFSRKRALQRDAQRAIVHPTARMTIPARTRIP